MGASVIDVLEKAMGAVATAPAEKKAELVDNISRLIQRISGDVVQINERNDVFLEAQLPAIHAQLEAAEKRTEKAANQILTCCERMMPLLSECPDKVKSELQNYINIIFAAGNFQDLVAQHLNEVRRIVDDVGEDATDIRAILSSPASEDAFSHQNRARFREKRQRPDAHLLNGPSTIVD
ncbi:MAG: hypothetical protein WC989_08820 [Micavibrio sp.]